MCALIGCYLRIALAGFRRYATYRQAALAGTATNVVFGLIKISILSAVYAAQGGGSVGGYDLTMTITYVWLGQGLLSVVQFWGDADLDTRIRTGDVVIDLTRPWNLGMALLAEDLGRAAFASLARFVPPLAIGALLFPFRWPTDPAVLAFFALSALLAVVISQGIRFLLSLSTFWLLDPRGVSGLYRVGGATLAGLEIPLNYFPSWAQTALWFTPFPGMMQSPIDVFVQHGSAAALLAHQALWAVLLTVAGQVVLRRAVHKVVVQGG
ncbi:ABC-2 family transporter protein [Kutzneria viridogrisea]|uniref:ABC transporter permease n=2 Tax=Kutzneria TaxID=43356 RepID=W5WKX0_9PSEU|nr:ABC-2 family transporter protein [Kutzneria albida]AHI01416.1 hypothetical protein KALB_8058 [Kutzneria albida DSM 43870]MBA8931376.1 ABC-2 type transport system permease protein [Kutzneria viridogrisea]